MKRFVVAAGAAALLVLSPSARADEPIDERAQSSITSDVASYYRSEKTIAYTFLALGTAAAAGGTVLVATRDEEFSRGLGWSLVTIGGLQALGSLFYAFQVDAQASQYGALAANDPTAFKREEGDHIQGTTSRFLFYRTAEAALALAGAGVAVYGFAADKDAWKGVGIGVASQAALFFVIDGFGQARAKDYERRVKSFVPNLSVQPTAHGASLGFSMAL